jgi:hypothetical protein
MVESFRPELAQVSMAQKDVLNLDDQMNAAEKAIENIIQIRSGVCRWCKQRCSPNKTCEWRGGKQMVLAAVMSRLADERLGERPLTETGTIIPLCFRLAQQFRQLGKNGRDALRLVAREQFAAESATSSFSKYT